MTKVTCRYCKAGKLPSGKTCGLCDGKGNAYVKAAEELIVERVFAAIYPGIPIDARCDEDEVWRVRVGDQPQVFKMEIGSDDDWFDFVRRHPEADAIQKQTGRRCNLLERVIFPFPSDWPVVDLATNKRED